MRSSIGVSASGGIGFAAGQPVGQVDIRHFHHRLQRIEVGLGQTVEMRAHKSADHQVVFERPAMRGAKQEAPAPVRPARRGSGSVIDGLSYNGALWTCQPVDPDLLAPLFAPLTSLRGIGPAVAGLIARAAGGERVIDLLFHMPESYLDRSARPTIRAAQPGTVATLAVEVVRHERPANSRQPWRIMVRTIPASPSWCSSSSPARRRCRPARRLLVSGKLDMFNGRLTIAHPDHVVPADQPDRIPVIEPVWPLTAGLWPRQVAGGLAQALNLLPEFPEWHDPALLKREKWPPFAQALRAVQMPDKAEPDKRNRARLAYDELLAGQVARP